MAKGPQAPRASAAQVPVAVNLDMEPLDRQRRIAGRPALLTESLMDRGAIERSPAGGNPAEAMFRRADLPGLLN